MVDDVSDSIDLVNRSAVATTQARATAVDCLLAGIEAALPSTVVDERVAVDEGCLRIDPVRERVQQYDLDGYNRVLLVGGGKAAGELAVELVRRLDTDDIDGVVVGTESLDAGPVEVVAGRHPVPGEKALSATDRIIDLAADAGSETLVVAVLTGGGSALLPAPAGDCTLDELRATTRALLRAGVPIEDVNAVRKHCSAIKGGHLAAACAPAPVVTLAISDVVGDDPATIASGPTVPDPTTYADALAVVDRHGIDLPNGIRAHLEAGAAGERSETPTELPGSTDRFHLLATNRTAVDGARRAASDRDYETVVLASEVTGEAREIGPLYPPVAEAVRSRGDPVEPPVVLLSGGELTVTVDGDGSGGPNAECALAAALDLDTPSVAFASVDTDGIDGNSDAAGGIVDATTVDDERGASDGESVGITVANARAALDRNDAATILDERAGLLRTGPTGTNVNDLRVLVVEPEQEERGNRE